LGTFDAAFVEQITAVTASSTIVGGSEEFVIMAQLFERLIVMVIFDHAALSTRPLAFCSLDPESCLCSLMVLWF
jgi:hypothetical protein